MLIRVNREVNALGNSYQRRLMSDEPRLSLRSPSEVQ